MGGQVRTGRPGDTATRRTFITASPRRRLAASIIFNALKLTALGVLIYALAAPPPILVTLGAQQTVRATNPKLGIHTRLTDEPEEWKIKKTCELVRAMGSPWIVEYFPWG